MEQQKRYKLESDTDFEIKFYEGILSRRADFVQVLSALGDLYTRKGLSEKGLEIDKKLAQLRPDDPLVLYNLSCSYSLLNQIDKSLAAIKLAIDAGYDDFPFLEKDSDLKNLLSDRRFQLFYSGIRSQKGTLKEQEKQGT